MRWACSTAAFSERKGARANHKAMWVALLFLAQAATYGPAPPAQPPPTSAKAPECAPQPSTAKPHEIIVCAVKPNGYRLDPDVLAARKAKKQGDSGRPRSPRETYADHSCTIVGPFGCRGTPTVNLIAAAATAAKIGDRLAKGQEVGSIFETDPHPTEYTLYQQAKRDREAKEAAAAAAKVKAAAR